MNGRETKSLFAVFKSFKWQNKIKYRDWTQEVLKMETKIDVKGVKIKSDNIRNSTHFVSFTYACECVCVCLCVCVCVCMCVWK